MPRDVFYSGTALLLPPSSLLICVAIGWLLQRRWVRVGRSLTLIGFGLLYVLSTPFVADLLLRSLESDRPVTLLQARRAGAIVVLGGDLSYEAPEYGGDTVGVLSLARIRYGAWLQRQTGLPLLITGGPLGGSGLPVAVAMQRTFAEFGIPVRWVEDASQDTWENAKLSARLLRSENIKTVLLVTHSWHMPRAKAAFVFAGLDVIAAPTGFTPWPAADVRTFLPDARALQMSAYATHEWIGIAWYEVAYLR